MQSILYPFIPFISYIIHSLFILFVVFIYYVHLSSFLQQEFTKKNRDKLKKFGMFKKYEDSERFLSDNPELTCEETANYLVLWCIDLAVEEVGMSNISSSPPPRLGTN